MGIRFRSCPFLLRHCLELPGGVYLGERSGFVEFAFHPVFSICLLLFHPFAHAAFSAWPPKKDPAFFRSSITFCEKPGALFTSSHVLNSPCSSLYSRGAGV